MQLSALLHPLVPILGVRAFVARPRAAMSVHVSSQVGLSLRMLTPTENHPSPSKSRRNFLFSIAGSGAAAFLPAQSSDAAAISASSVRVAEWPNLAYLEPIFELKLSVNALVLGLKDKSKWPLIQKRLEKFFKGAMISERNYYGGVSIKYMDQIKYPKDEIKEYIKLDKEQRFNTFDACLNNLELLKNDLAGNESENIIFSDADAALRALNEWFSYIPSSDLEAVEMLFKTVRGADSNRDGHLDDNELNSLSQADQEVWKKRVDLYGD